MKKYIRSAKEIDGETYTVIFRKGYNPFSKRDEYIVLLPEVEANPGRVFGFSMEKDNYDQWVSWASEEFDYWYLMDKTKIVHKNDPIIPELVDALERTHDMKVRVTERIQRH